MFDSFRDPMDWDYSSPGSSVHGIFQARTVEQVAIPFSKDIPDSEIKPMSPALAAVSLLLSHLGSPLQRMHGGNGVKTQGEDSH